MAHSIKYLKRTLLHLKRVVIYYIRHYLANANVKISELCKTVLLINKPVRYKQQ